MSHFGQRPHHAPGIVVAGRYDLPRGVWFERHEHPVPQLAWAARGVLSVRAQGRTWVLPSGLALWIPAGRPHATGAATAADMLGIYVTAKRCPIRWSEPTVVAIDGLARELISHLAEADLADHPRAHAEALLFTLLRPTGNVLIDVAMPDDPRARVVADALAGDPADPRSLAAWGRTAGASERTLGRLWVAETGLGFAAWRVRLRLQSALPLLASGMTVYAVARRVGYQSPSAFVAAFRREVGVAPGSYFGVPA